MTTHELARLLLAGPNVDAYIEGYEGGLVDVAATRMRLGDVSRDVREWTYYGPHGRVAGEDHDGVLDADGQPCLRRAGLILSRHAPEETE